MFWELLREKADETADDTDWVGTNTAPTSGTATLPRLGGNSLQWTGIEVVVVGVTNAGALQARATMTIDIQLVEIFTAPNNETTPDTLTILCDSAVEEDVPLQRKVYFPLNGAQEFTIRLSGDTNDAVDNLLVYWRPVTR